MRRIDVHSHFQCLEFIKHLHGRSALPRSILSGGTYITQCALGFNVPSLPTLVDVEEKLRDLDRIHIDLSIISHGLPLGPEVLGGDEADAWAQRINDDLARIIQRYPGQFIGMGSIGFGDVTRSLAEVDRCVLDLGLKGFQVFSNIAGKTLGTPELLSVFKRIAELGVPVHLHPTIPLNLIGLERASDYLSLGFPYDSSLNVLRLIQSGLFDQAPNFKLIVSHIGGVLPYLRGRLEAYNAPSALVTDIAPLRFPLGHYVDQLYVDTVSYHSEALTCCCHVMGAKHVLYGTDHPFGDYLTAAELVERLDCSAAERESIYHGNAEELFGLS